jgi:hypothetical protein
MRLPLTALVSGLVFANGCVKEDAAMFIEGALPLLPTDCEVSAADQVFLPSGTLDLSSGRGYASFLKVRTNLPATFNSADLAGSPSYPDYGPVDNNVVIFESAAVDLSLQGSQDALDLFSTAASGIDGARFTCTAGECSTNPNDDIASKEVVPAAGTVFNVQTSLNQPQVIVTEGLSGNSAGILLDAFVEAAKLAGALNATGGIANAAIARDLNLLALPGQTQRVNVNISLTGTTTGSGDLRPVTSFVFPFGIDVCIGCLNPDAAFCRKFDAVVVPVDEENCIDGQDIPTAVCGCVDALGVPDGRFVTNDSEVCRPAP